MALAFPPPAARNTRTMKMRVIFGAVMIAALSALLWWDHALLEATAWRGVPLGAVIALLGVAAFGELSRMAAQSQVRTLPVTGVLCTLAVAISPLWARLVGPHEPMSLLLTAMGLGMLAIFLEQMIRARIADALRSVACTVLAVMYLGVGGAMLLELRLGHPGAGVGVLLMVIAAAKGTDMAAYFTGKAIGRHKLIPWLSPGKTWEGLAGGLVGGAGLALLVRWICNVSVLCVWQTVVFGLVVGLFGQVGDLCESLLKRSAKIKDSGQVFPEFGGVLDILDSLLLAAPVGQLLLMTMI